MSSSNLSKLILVENFALTISEAKTYYTIWSCHLNMMPFCEYITSTLIKIGIFVYNMNIKNLLRLTDSIINISAPSKYKIIVNPSGWLKFWNSLIYFSVHHTMDDNKFFCYLRRKSTSKKWDVPQFCLFRVKSVKLESITCNVGKIFTLRRPLKLKPFLIAEIHLSILYGCRKRLELYNRKNKVGKTV